MLEHSAYVCVLPWVHLQTVLMPHLPHQATVSGSTNQRIR